MKENASKKEIELVESGIVIPHIGCIAEGLGITAEELMKSNEKLRNMVLTLSRK